MITVNPKTQAWSILFTFSLCFFVVSAATFSSLGVVIPFMVNDLQWDWATAGMGFTLLALACGLSGYLPSITIKKLGVEGTLFIGLAQMVIGFILLYYTQTPAMYFGGCVLIGAGYSFVGPVPGTYIITHFFIKRATAFGFYYTMGGIGGVAGPLIVWLANDGFGNWRVHWLITLVMIVTSVVLMLFSIKLTDTEKLKVPPKQDNEQASTRVYETRELWTFKQAIRTPQFWLICAGYMSVLFVGTTVNSFSVAHLTQIGISFVFASTLLSTEALCNAISRIVGGFIAEYFDPKAMLQTALFLLGVGMLALSFGSSPLVLFLYAFAIGFGFGLTFLSSTVLLIRYFGSTPYIQLFGAMNFTATVAASAPYICGYMRDVTGSFVSSFLLIGAIPMVVLVAVIFMKPPKLNNVTDAAGKSAAADDNSLHIVKEGHS
ncbi:MFS transporter [Alteromonas lipolytica]|uniref:Major facilitator superfamily (MFS) profile domain-containing protein n=1 Tax=Alteromonas lipolytica TaxID=1856405 RepID=A0A1E8FKB0_9ALTE|nr:MFS transporter [Alteromonas lipolytica]OFI36344.1 hypothetical protein BFC17_00245 [Alteromonas lipolytica]GGF70650.1 MFS transporter [Alteromonas lipolytica]